MANSLRTFFEVYPADPRGTRPIGMRINDVVFANGLAGVDLVTGAPAEGITAQMSLILEHLRSLMEQAGGDLDGVVRCAAYVTNMEDRETIYGPWEELFPDPADRPALKALMVELPEGHLVHLDVFGLIGGVSGPASTSPTSTRETPASVSATSTSRRAATATTRPPARSWRAAWRPRPARRWRTWRRS